MREQIIHFKKIWPNGSEKSICGRYLTTAGVFTMDPAEVTCVKCRGTREFCKIASNEISQVQTKADFLWPCEDDSIEEAGYEFANARTEQYRKLWWNILIERIRANALLDALLEKEK